MTAAALALSGCGSRAANTNSNTGAQPTVVDVAATQVIVQPIPTYFGATGNLASDAATDVAPAVGGKIVEVNCLAALSWTNHVVATGLRERGGAIVNVSSTAALKPAANIGFYGASKAMLSHLTQQLAVELAPTIRVNAVAPAVVKTKFAAALYEGRESDVASVYPLRRLGEPADIGHLVAFLASPRASWITGQTIVIDGGLTLTGGA